jgi:hypothetical protein
MVICSFFLIKEQTTHRLPLKKDGRTICSLRSIVGKNKGHAFSWARHMSRPYPDLFVFLFFLFNGFLTP